MANYLNASSPYEFAVGDRVIRASDGEAAFCVESQTHYAILQFEDSGERVEVEQFDRSYHIENFIRPSHGGKFDVEVLEWQDERDDDGNLSLCECRREKRQWDLTEGACDACGGDIPETDLADARSAADVLNKLCGAPVEVTV